MQTIREMPESQIGGEDIGSGSTNDSKTTGWLKAWYAKGREWPWFVKSSFSTVRKIEGKTEPPKKIDPKTCEKLLSSEYLDSFYNSPDSVPDITKLAVTCQRCGRQAHSLQLTRPDRIAHLQCINCRCVIYDVAYTLRWFCNRVLPDANAIIQGLLSRDLDRAGVFDGFSVFKDAAVGIETDNPGGKSEWGRLANYASLGRLRITNVGNLEDVRGLSNQEKDEYIANSAKENNAILLTQDGSLIATALGLSVFVIRV